MNSSSVARATAAFALVAGAVTACSSGGTKSSSSASTKAAFCSANVTIDKAAANAQSPQDFLTVLKQNGPALAAMRKNAPAGRIGTEAKALVGTADKAVSSNNINDLEQVPQSYGGDIDTFCGVDGNGDPLPAYFAQGKGSQFCSAIDQINTGTSQAQGPDDILAFLKAHQDLVAQVSSNAGNLPASLKSEVQTLVGSARQAIATNKSDPLGSPDVQNDAADASLYCGQNQ